jgi:hypothetical protein
MRRLLRSVAFLAILAQGCAAVRIEPEVPLRPSGPLASQKGRPGLVIGAPHGRSDAGTDRISVELARRTGFGLVVAAYADLDSGHRRLNVNRPTEGVQGASPSEEVETDQARQAYEAYVGRVNEVAQGPLLLYVELHGNGRKESASRIEIATVGVSREEAWRLRTLLELVRDAHLGGKPEVPRLDVVVEPLDRLTYTASAAKQGGILRLPRRAIHIELPRAARTLGREAYTDVLADFLSQAAGLLLVQGQ